MSLHFCPSCSNRINTNNVPAIRTCRNKSCRARVYIYGDDPYARTEVRHKKRELLKMLQNRNHFNIGLDNENLDRVERQLLREMADENKVQLNDDKSWWLTEPG